MMRTASIFRLTIAALTLATLAACGGSSGDESAESSRDVAPAFLVSSQQGEPIVHEFTDPGTYTLTLSGDYASTVPSADTLKVWFSFSGQGNLSGNSEPTYSVVGGKVKVQQSVTVTLEGVGPWEVTILCGTTFASGTMSALTLDTAKH